MDQSSLPKSRKGRARREQILDAAMEAFAVQGFRSVSLASLAPAIGITEQGVMHYFPTKVHLLLGVLERREARDTERFTALAQQGLPQLSLMIEVMRSNASEPHLSTLYSVLMAESVDPDHPAHHWFVERNARVRRQLGEAMAMAMRNGELRQDLDPEAVGAHMVAVFDGLATQRALAEDFDMVAVFTDYIRSLSPEAQDGRADVGQS